MKQEIPHASSVPSLLGDAKPLAEPADNVNILDSLGPPSRLPTSRSSRRIVAVVLLAGCTVFAWRLWGGAGGSSEPWRASSSAQADPRPVSASRLSREVRPDVPETQRVPVAGLPEAPAPSGLEAALIRDVPTPNSGNSLQSSASPEPSAPEASTDVVKDLPDYFSTRALGKPPAKKATRTRVERAGNAPTRVGPKPTDRRGADETPSDADVDIITAIVRSVGR